MTNHEQYAERDTRPRCDWCGELHPSATSHSIGTTTVKCDACYRWDRQHPDIARLLESGI